MLNSIAKCNLEEHKEGTYMMLLSITRFNKFIWTYMKSKKFVQWKYQINFHSDYQKMVSYSSIYLPFHNVQKLISITYFIDYNSQSFCSCVNRKVSDTICSFYCTSRISFSQLNYQNQTFFIVSSKLLSELLLKAKQENKNHHHLCDQPAENA